MAKLRSRTATREKPDKNITAAQVNPATGGSGSSREARYRGLDAGGNGYAGMVGMSELHRGALDASSPPGYTAHRKEEAARGQYGYAGGRYVPQAQAAGKINGPEAGGFSYASAPQYASRYQSQIDDLTAQILGRAAFEYDPEKDPTYQQYKESYTRSGERAMQDTLGQFSARTGGLASSYAGSAAQQTYDNYMSALADKIPELRQLAYSMYQDEGAQQRANLEMLMALEQGDYAKYQGLLSQYNTDRSFDYGVHRDGISDQRYDTEWNYQAGRDQLADRRYEDETAYSREQDAWQKEQYQSENEYSRALERAQTLAAAGDFSGYEALGYSQAEISSLKAAYDAAQLLSRQSGRGGTSRSGSGSRSAGAGGDGGGVYQQMYDAGIRSYDDAYEWLRAKGYGTTDANRYAKGLVNKIEAEDFGGSEPGGGEPGGGYSLEDLDTDAVLALGIGPVSYDTVNRLYQQEKVDIYTGSDGQLSVRWANGYNAGNYRRDSESATKIQSPLDKLLGR